MRNSPASQWPQDQKAARCIFLGARSGIDRFLIINSTMAGRRSHVFELHCAGLERLKKGRSCTTLEYRGPVFSCLSSSYSRTSSSLLLAIKDCFEHIFHVCRLSNSGNPQPRQMPCMLTAGCGQMLSFHYFAQPHGR